MSDKIKFGDPCRIKIGESNLGPEWVYGKFITTDEYGHVILNEDGNLARSFDIEKLKTNGTKFTLEVDGKKVADGIDVELIAEDVPDAILDRTPDKYGYLFVIADLILNLHLDEQAKNEIPQWAWNNLINTMIEFKKATDGIDE